MNKNRLLTLATFLETLDPSRFNFGRWVGDGWTGDETLSCGTTACAFGWAATIPEFRSLGLRLCHDDVGGHVTYGDDHGLQAARVFFDLMSFEANLLFLPTTLNWDSPDVWPRRLMAEANPADVAMNIRALVGAS
jgi:hypothetical protein